MKDEQQSVLAPWHMAVFNIGAYLEINKSFFLRRVSRYNWPRSQFTMGVKIPYDNDPFFIHHLSPDL
jgi:hypothetical protein